MTLSGLARIAALLLRVPKLGYAPAVVNARRIMRRRLAQQTSVQHTIREELPRAASS